MCISVVVFAVVFAVVFVCVSAVVQRAGCAACVAEARHGGAGEVSGVM